MRTWSVVNQKGGSGKTTLLLHVAIAALNASQTVAIIDTDEQRSADKWAALRAARTGEREPVIVSASPEQLKGMIASARENGTDLLLIDTSAKIDRTLGYVAGNSDMIIVPTRSSLLDRDSLDDTLGYLEMIQALPKVAVVYNAFTSDKAERLAMEQLITKHGVMRIEQELDHNPAYGTLLGKGSGATEGRAKKPGATIRELYRQLSLHDAKAARAKARART